MVANMLRRRRPTVARPPSSQPRRPAPARPATPPNRQASMVWNPVSQNAWQAAAQRMGALGTGTGRAPSPGPPPATVEGGNQRIGADEQFNLGTGDTNQALLQAAQRYGGVNTVTQVGVDAQGNPITSQADVVANPNSTVAGIDRTLKFGLRDLGDSMERGNTFFSSIHQRGRNEAEAEANRQRSQADIDYNDTVLRLLGGQARNLADRDAGRRAGDQTDINAAAALDPEQGPVPKELQTPPALSPKALAFQQAQARGQVKLKNGRWYYQRADGKWIPA